LATVRSVAGWSADPPAVSFVTVVGSALTVVGSTVVFDTVTVATGGGASSCKLRTRGRSGDATSSEPPAATTASLLASVVVEGINVAGELSVAVASPPLSDAFVATAGIGIKTLPSDEGTPIVSVYVGTFGEAALLGFAGDRSYLFVITGSLRGFG
jgi:hypothetical protein